MKSWTQRLLCLFACLTLLFSWAAMAQPTETEEEQAFVAFEDVFLLDDMREDAEKLAQLPLGELVTVVDTDQDEKGLTWCLIEYEEEIGFVKREQLSDEPPAPAEAPAPYVTEDGEYTDKEHVAVYIRQFGHLPGNYITKREAQELGWVSRLGNLWEVAPGKSIGGDRFGNYEGILPDKRGRTWKECDIDFDGSYRDLKRIVYSSDGLIYYTDDHYNTFEDMTDFEPEE